MMGHGILNISIDGVTKKMYESIRCGSDFGKLMENIKRLHEIKRGSPGGMRVEMSVVVMRSNYKYLSDFIEFARGNGFEAVHFNTVDVSRSPEEEISGDQEITRGIKDIFGRTLERARKYGLALTSDFPGCDPVYYTGVPPGESRRLRGGKKRELSGLYLRGSLNALREEIRMSSSLADDKKVAKPLRCYIPWLSMYIHYDGSVLPHCLCRKSVSSLCQGGLKKAWNSPVMQEYRRHILEEDRNSFCHKKCLEGRVSAHNLGCDQI